MQNCTQQKELYQQCTRCIMDTSCDKEISFNTEGVCNHCLRYDELLSSRVILKNRGKILEDIVAKIKKAGKGKEYDCIVGVSGGVDSTYVAYLTKELGLRPLAIHFDNGWNSELAVKNIERVLNKLEIDLHTYVIDWPEFRDLQRAFLKASTSDGEIPTDHAIFALLWQEANKRGVKYIISGMNFVTESISVPSWSYGHSDWRYIKDVHKKYGTIPLRTYPHFSFPYLFYVNIIRKVRTVSILNYVDYNKDHVMSVLQDKLGWEYYGGKHYESIYTRFYQGYILPKKFGIDKRYGHLSDLINSGQLKKEDALNEIEKSPYPSDMQEQDKVYVIKKLGLSLEQFDEIMNSQVKSFCDYKNSFDFVQMLKKLVNKLRVLGMYPR
jgi:N-acetyl sugar amidotransferase